MKKRGLSTIVTSLILILLVLVAVGVVWIVVRNIISEGAEQVALGKLTMNLEVKKVTVNDGSVDVQVKRNSGAGELSGIKFIIDDGINTQVFEKPTTMAELGTQSFTLVYSGLVKEVSIAGIFETESGKEFTGNEIDKFEFSDEEVIKNMNGLVSWWRFEGDALDEVGDNDGIINGANCNADGKYGRACEFDGVDDYVDCGDDSSLDFGMGDFTVGAYCSTTFEEIGGNPLAFIGRMRYDVTPELRYGWFATFKTLDPQNNLAFGMSDGINHVNTWSPLIPTSTTQITDGNWHHVMWVVDRQNNEVRGFLDSQPAGTLDLSSISGSISYPNVKQYIGRGGWGWSGGGNFNGTIDEVMIFNKALSEDEVKALYGLDLS